MNKKEQRERDLERIKQSQRHKRDHSAYFNLVGGPFHGLRLRLYAPWDTLKFENGARYEISQPLAKNGEWVYIHDKESTGIEAPNT